MKCVHIRAAAPTIFQGDQPQADLVFEHMRRRIDLDMHAAPQRHPRRSAVCGCCLLIMHDVLAPFDLGRVSVVMRQLTIPAICH